MVDRLEIELLEKRKRRALFILCLMVVVLAGCSVFRFVPRLDDFLSGKPQYVRALTDSLARQLATQSQMPLIVEPDEKGSCQRLHAHPVPDEEVRGNLYVLTYSEQQHITCVTGYAVPQDATKFSNAREITPTEGTFFGPKLLQSVKGVPFDRSVHVYSPEYLRRLHWRYTQHFSLSPSEAASLASRSYYSAPEEPDGKANIELDYQEIRAEVATRHRQINLALDFVLIAFAAVLLSGGCTLLLVFRAASRYCRLYHFQLTAKTFLTENIATRAGGARQQYFAQQRQTQEQISEQERLRVLRLGWAESLRSALPSLTDEQLRSRVQACLGDEAQDLEEMKSLWVEIQERAGQKTPADKLNMLLESARSYSSEEEFRACREEAFAILAKSGFRSARNFAITMHDEFKIRAREMEESEKSDQSVAS